MKILNFIKWTKNSYLVFGCGLANCSATDMAAELLKFGSPVWVEDGGGICTDDCGCKCNGLCGIWGLA